MGTHPLPIANLAQKRGPARKPRERECGLWLRPPPGSICWGIGNPGCRFALPGANGFEASGFTDGSQRERPGQSQQGRRGQSQRGRSSRSQRRRRGRSQRGRRGRSQRAEARSVATGGGAICLSGGKRDQSQRRDAVPVRREDARYFQARETHGRSRGRGAVTGRGATRSRATGSRRHSRSRPPPPHHESLTSAGSSAGSVGA
jgi:hypothetical protein